jgi:hypothetical protein
MFRAAIGSGWIFLCAAALGCTGAIGAGGASKGGVQTTTGTGGNSGLGVGGTVGTSACAPSTSFAPPRLWRLNDQQYGNVVHDVFGSAITVPAAVSEASVLGAEAVTSADRLTIGSEMTAGNYMDSAHSTAVSAVADLPALLGCGSATTVDPSCVQSFIQTKVARAFRRPVTDDEAQSMLALYQLGAPDGPAEGVRVLMEYVLQAPAFLWRTELGGMPAATSAPQPLGSYELAGALGFLFLNSAPDGELWDKATTGTLTDPTVLAMEVDRLMVLPAVKANVASQVGSWLDVLKAEATVKDPNVFPQFTDQIKNELTQSAQLFVQDVVESGKLSDLLTSPRMFLNQELATLYGVPGVIGQSLVPVDVAAPERHGGILTQPALLAANAHVDGGDVVHRGLYIYLSMVCGATPPSPPANAASVNNALPADYNQRQRAAFRASRADCAICHTNFDPFGLLTERYDPIGRYAEKDAAGQTIDQSATINVGSKVLDGPANGIGDLISRLQSSRQFSDCASGKLAAIALGRVVSTDNTCALRDVQDDFAKSGSFTGLMRAIATSPAFQTRDARLQ